MNKVNVQELLGNEVIIKEFSIMNNRKSESFYDYSIMIRITEACNLKCDICKWNEGIHYKLEDIKLSIKNIISWCKDMNFKRIHFYTMGGETSVHPHFIEVLQFIKTFQTEKFLIDIEFQTNLSVSSDKFLQALEYIDYFSVTYHRNELVSKNLLDQFLKNLYSIPISKLTTLDVSLELIEEQEKNQFYNEVRELIKLPFKNIEYIYNFYHYTKNKECFNQHYDFYLEMTKYRPQQSYNIDGVIYSPNELFARGIACKDIHCEAGKSGITMNGDGKTFPCDTIISNHTIDNTTKPYTNLITDKFYKTKLNILQKIGHKCPVTRCTSAFYNEKRYK
jgi:organic radical activating enzyme